MKGSGSLIGRLADAYKTISILPVIQENNHSFCKLGFSREKRAHDKPGPGPFHCSTLNGKYGSQLKIQRY